MPGPPVGSPETGAGDRGWRRELGVFALAYATYFGVRAVTEGHAGAALDNAHELIRLERELGVAAEHVVQGVVTGSEFLTDAANAVYIYGHWPVLLIAGVMLFRHHRPQYHVLRDACLISGFVGLVIFALLPVAPPRLTDLPIVDTVTLGTPGYRLLLPHSLVNEYAAMPSFHAGWNLLVGIVLFQATTHLALRAFAVVMPIAMAFAVVATANHFVLDVFAGVAIVLLALPAAYWLERRRSRPRLEIGKEGPDASITGQDDRLPVPDRPPGGERSAAAAVR